jgi:carbon-monoxide dehydrogenase medium subunit
VARRHGDFAVVGVVCSLRLAGDGTVAHASVAYLGVADTPVRPAAVEAAVRGAPAGDESWARAAAAARDVLAPAGDLHGTAAYRRHVAGVLTERALRRAAAQARSEVAA